MRIAVTHQIDGALEPLRGRELERLGLRPGGERSEDGDRIRRLWCAWILHDQIARRVENGLRIAGCKARVEILPTRVRRDRW